jgi:hypothetical protein
MEKRITEKTGLRALEHDLLTLKRILSCADNWRIRVA